ncbi:MAG TPA: phosphopentomutase [Bacillota bacterium]|nr:phosphopentomutase [Bacillota bacterium]
MKNKRVFLIVLDSLGVGEAPDAAEFGDVGANTLKSISASPGFKIPNLLSLGLGNIEELDFLGRVASPAAAIGRLTERSRGKDTTTGHWEIAGIISERPMPTYPEGFPEEIIEEFIKRTGRGVLCNKRYSGTQAILDYGREHISTGKLIVYTSADSVFQIAAHEEVVPVEQLYEYCRIAREIMTGEHAVGRIIARPFIGEYPNYTRTSRRHDFSLAPPRKTIIDALREAGYDTVAVGKINDIFAGRGISEHYPTEGNSDGMRIIRRISERQDWRGLCFANLVDFDSSYGHRRDIDGYARALAEFDGFLGGFLTGMREDDILIITADHGCDPGFIKTTDHTREYVPLIVFGSSIKPVNLGTRQSFADIAATLAEWFGVGFDTPGVSFAGEVDR